MGEEIKGEPCLLVTTCEGKDALVISDTKRVHALLKELLDFEYIDSYRIYKLNKIEERILNANVV